MRIAHVTDCYLPGLGGIEIQVNDLAQHQLAAGHDVEVLTCHPVGSGAADAAACDSVEGGSDDNQVPVRRFPAGIWSMPTPAALRALRKTITSGGFDVLHAHSSVVSPFAWTAARVASMAGVPTVLTLHSLLPVLPRTLRLTGQLSGWSRWPIVWTAVSEVAAVPLRVVLGHDAVSVVPNGIDPLAWQSAADARPWEPGGVLTIVSVMRLSLRKRPMALLHTLAGIRERVPQSVPLRAVVIGSGPQQPNLERFLRRSGADSWVTLTGRLTRAQIGPMLSAADVYLAPADRESFGIAALEARCAGLPVVAMAKGGVGEFIRNGQEGFLVHSDDEMVRVTANLLGAPDLAELRSIQEHNRITTPEMTWERVVGLSLDRYRAAGAAVPADMLEARV
jgi:glycosyltransferase involved in cell wall biosynthesis